MGILNIDEHVEEHRLLEIRYPEKAVMIGTATASVPASKTLSFDDAGKFLICDSGSAIVLTVPSDATAGWIDAVTIAACRKGVGSVTFAAGAGVTLRGDLATPAQYGSKGIVRIGTNEWTVIA